MLWTFGRLLFDDPGLDPMPAIIELVGRVYFFALAAALSGIAYIVCRIFQV